MSLHSIPWVGDGKTFEVTPKSPTPAAAREALLERARVLKEMFTGTGEMPKAIVEELRVEAMREAGIRGSNILIRDILAQQDPRIRKMTPDEVQAKLTQDEWLALVKDIHPGIGKLIDQAAGKKPENEEDEEEPQEPAADPRTGAPL